MLKSEKETLELPGESDDKFKSGIVEYYMMRPNHDDIKNISLALFAYYYFKPASDIADHYWVQMQNRSKTEGQFLFTATGETANTEPTNSTESDNIGFPSATRQPESVDVDSLVNSLNVKQRAVFHVVAGCAREKVKYSNSVTPKNVKPLSLSITGGAGVGKSRLTETCYAF